MTDRVLASRSASAPKSLPKPALYGPSSRHLIGWDGILPAHPTTAGPRALARRWFDVLCAVLVLIFTLPLLLAIFILLKLEDGGPGLSGEWRVGCGGRMFRLWKFRTAEASANDRLSAFLEQDPRAGPEWRTDQIAGANAPVTPLGSFLRASGLDQLPQFLNVLSGEMSIVGPRPITATEMTRYDHRFSYYVCVRPGITGLSQTGRRGRMAHLCHDAAEEFYVRRWNFGLDFAILFRTIKAMARAEEL